MRIPYFCNMYRNYIVVLLYFLSMGVLYAQSVDEDRNRAVFNRIEYFYNADQLDSIYSLAADDFKNAISKSQLLQVFQGLKTEGNITDVEKLGYSSGIASYLVKVGSNEFEFLLGLTKDAYSYNTLRIRPYQKPIPQKKDSVIASTEVVDPFDKSIDSIARRYVQQSDAQSLSVAILRHGQLKRYFYGETSAGSGLTPDENTQYEIGSITKTFTATLLADLVEKGTIQLDDAIGAYLPDSVAQNESIAAITFKQLANHTAGLPRMPDNYNKIPGYSDSQPYEAYDRAALFSALKKLSLPREPDTEYEYSNFGYGLLGELIAIISKKNYIECVTEVITAPLHMTNTSDQIADDVNIAPPHHQGQQVPMWKFKSLAGAGALKSTVNDLLRYAITQLSMPDNSLQQAMALTRLFTFFVPPTSDIGLAWHMDIYGDITCIWHNGGTAGSSSFMGLIPDEKSAVIVLSNASLSVDQTANEIIQKVIGN